MPPPNNTAVNVAILAKAPIPGHAKTRLVPAISAQAAANLQERFTERAVATAVLADVGPITLWCDPDIMHPSFVGLVARMRLTLRPQPQGDLGARMYTAAAAANGPVLVIGTDCPALTEIHLRSAAGALAQGNDVVLIPAVDGGYVLIGMRQAHPGPFSGIAWGGKNVAAETRMRIMAQRLKLIEFPPLWDVDTESDLARLRREFPALKF